MEYGSERSASISCFSREKYRVLLMSNCLNMICIPRRMIGVCLPALQWEIRYFPLIAVHIIANALQLTAIYAPGLTARFRQLLVERGRAALLEKHATVPRSRVCQTPQFLPLCFRRGALHGKWHRKPDGGP